MTATAQQVLNEARAHLGFVEGPNNAEPFGPAIGYPSGVPWCDQYVSYVAAKTGAADIIGRFQYCPSHVNWFKARGQWGTTPRTGAVVFFDWDGDGVADHVGFVEKDMDSKRIQTLEGNAREEGSVSPGARDGVFRRYRSKSLVLGYGYPAYRSPLLPPTPLPRPSRGGARVVPLVVDGSWGPRTTARLQQYLHVVPADGVRGPQTVRALQHWVGSRMDGVLGPDTVRHLQAKVGAARDGVLGPDTVRHLQRFLNRAA